MPRVLFVDREAEAAPLKRPPGLRSALHCRIQPDHVVTSTAERRSDRMDRLNAEYLHGEGMSWHSGAKTYTDYHPTVSDRARLVAWEVNMMLDERVCTKKNKKKKKKGKKTARGFADTVATVEEKEEEEKNEEKEEEEERGEED